MLLLIHAEIQSWRLGGLVWYKPWEQGSWGQHGAHLGPTEPRWAPCWPHELCYLGRCPLTSIGNPIVEIKRSYDHRISTMGFPILVRWHFILHQDLGYERVENIGLQRILRTCVHEWEDLGSDMRVYNFSCTRHSFYLIDYLRYRKMSLVHILLLSCKTILKFPHQCIFVVLGVNFLNDLIFEMGVADKRDFVRFQLNTSLRVDIQCCNILLANI